MAQPRRACTHRLRAPLGHACLLKGGTIFTSPAGRSSTAFDFNVSISDHERQRRREAQERGYVTTILGRRRQLPDAMQSRNRAAQSHALRAAINTPIQGSAADIATAAMLRIAVDPTLRELGWRLLLQVRRCRAQRWDGGWRWRQRLQGGQRPSCICALPCAQAHRHTMNPATPSCPPACLPAGPICVCPALKLCAHWS